MNKFIFDVDGTLTPSRGRISSEYADFFSSFCSDNPVYLVTGSDKDKTIEQLGERIVGKAVMVFNCSGNDVWQKGENIYTNEWRLPEEVDNYLMNTLELIDYPEMTGNHLEVRPGTVNFSIVGRNADTEQREKYVEYDVETNQRQRIVEEFNKFMPDRFKCEAVIGGETGIDIYPCGGDKSQILKQIKYTNKDKLFFFGDKIEPGGNDFPLAEAIRKKRAGNVIPVRNWKHTFETLSYYQEAKIAK
jgi:phosphomannomutase